MRYSNKLNLPIGIYKAVTNGEDRTPVDNVYHVTEFIKPVRQIKLERLHYHDIEIDISSCINTLIGQCVHKVLELADPKHSEKKIEFVTNGIKIVGRIDKYNYDEFAIIDYKTCRKSHKEFEDWYLQGMLYAYGMLLTENIKTKEIRFYGLVKDAVIARGDPTVIPYIYKIQDSDYMHIADYIRDKAKLLSSDAFPECSDTERWKRPDVWKLFAKEDSPRALKVLDHKPSEEERGVKIVKFVPGECMKCNHYCLVKKFCEEIKKI